MFEFLLELSEMNAPYAIYTGIILSLALKYFWSWNNDSFTSTSFSNYKYEKVISSPQLVLKNFRNQSNVLFNWILQIVRRKEAAADDTDCPVSH
jgi:hypothetical protein